MKKSYNIYFLSALLFLIGFNDLYGQNCLPSGITLKTQQEIDDFPTDYPNCTEIGGNVYISGYPTGDITNLNGLSQITDIFANLSISHNAFLTSLSGLNNLSTIGNNLYFTNNDALISLSGLTNLSSVSNIFQINQNDVLTSGSALPNLTSVGRITVSENANMTSLSMFANVTSFQSHISVSFNEGLTSLTGLDNIASIGGNLDIQYNASLTSLMALGNLTEIDGFIRILNNGVLTNLSGIQNIDPLTIESSFSGADDLNIFNNPELSSCAIQSICDAIGLGKTTDIHDNATGCDSETEVENACLVVPIELLSFECKDIDNKIQLNWKTVTEKNNDYFMIEHSLDGVNFYSIGEVSGQQISSRIKDYSFIHKNPLQGINYYRLKQVDLDGLNDISDVVSVHFNKEINDFYPNPATHTIYFNENTYSVLIYDMFGKEIIRSNSIAKSLDISTLIPGVYNININNGKKQERLIVYK